MLKKTGILLLALCLTLTAAACGGKDDFTTDLAAFYESLDKESYPMMMELTGELAEAAYPGLEAVSREQTVLYGAAISATACEIAMVEVSDPKDVETVERIFQERVDAQIAGGAWYPETIEQWQKNAQIVTRGRCVCLFVAPDDAPSPAEAFMAL